MQFPRSSMDRSPVSCQFVNARTQLTFVGTPIAARWHRPVPKLAQPPRFNADDVPTTSILVPRPNAIALKSPRSSDGFISSSTHEGNQSLHHMWRGLLHLFVMSLIVCDTLMLPITPLPAAVQDHSIFPEILLPSHSIAHAAAVARSVTSPAAPTKTGMSCVASYCATELKDCLLDPNCAKGLQCFVSCAVTSGSTKTPAGADVEEGACQVRCTDLYENPQLTAFTKCTLTDHGCYPALPEDERYPKLPPELSSVSTSVIPKLLRGRWYISAGLNDMFDTFDCQVHEFRPPKDTSPNPLTPQRIPVADATFSYRVALSRNQFLTRRGVKELYLKPLDGGNGHTDLPLQFDTSHKWGREIFSRTIPAPQSATPKAAVHMGRGNPAVQLALSTVPDYMMYEDKWTILSASDPEEDVDDSTSYMVVAYRGTNAAWNGYGGLNVYTRVPMNLQSLQSTAASRNSKEVNDMLQGIQQGLDKVGLTLDDLLPVDNSCSSTSLQ